MKMTAGKYRSERTVGQRNVGAFFRPPSRAENALARWYRQAAGHQFCAEGTAPGGEQGPGREKGKTKGPPPAP